MSIGNTDNVIESKSQKGNQKNAGIVVSSKQKTPSGDSETKTRLRRTKSVTQLEQISSEERRVRTSQLDKPCHKTGDSLFSWSSGFDRFEGFINWGALLLAVGGIRLFLENVLKYGIRVSPQRWLSWLITDRKNDYYVHTPIYLLIAQFHSLFAFYLEKRLSQNKISSKTGVIINVIHLIIIVLVPMVLLWFFTDEFSLLGRTVICSHNTILFLKLWSYAHVNHWCRKNQERTKKYLRKRSYSFGKLSKSSLSDEDEDYEDNYDHHNVSYSTVPVEYPNNLNLKDLFYFLVAPTLCYELNFPRSHTIRIKFLLRRVVEVFVLFNAILGLFQQWIIPTVINSFKTFSEMDYMKCAERILKLSVPNHLLWLIWFYMFFHSFMNTIGELLRFGDRNFYQDWWNAKDVGTFWKLWNLPVHKWCVRHIFVPLLGAKYRIETASIIVFLFSAFFHEYLVSIPLGMYKVGVFAGMLMQIPLIKISSLVRIYISERLGNVMVWASLIIGQPVAIMIYYHDYIIKNWDPSYLVMTDYDHYYNSTNTGQY